MRATYRGIGPYKAVVKDEKGKIVAECRHWHRNLHASSRSWGPAATSCADELLREVDPTAWLAALPDWRRRALGEAV